MKKILMSLCCFLVSTYSYAWEVKNPTAETADGSKLAVLGESINKEYQFLFHCNANALALDVYFKQPWNQTESEIEQKGFFKSLEMIPGTDKFHDVHYFNYRIDRGNLERMILQLDPAKVAHKGKLVGGMDSYWPEDLIRQIEKQQGKTLKVDGGGVTDTFHLDGIYLVRKTLGNQCNF
ncbi:hypothetical protein [Candidatus Nitrosacidococcus sp. I8]|uniref:hypothetical protein n=1 Tax=Candidatus Nitrosacidococcus sp. I8 TaxID=2942908 RepID=UPI002227D4A7|nr:hypothetical protein [Candidatus Nitrosacidococcus sp. I8]CAH9017651.1 hypothetical protein NURINAE_00478 [Candidatus Nitrosacidococcus sp. I8]